MKCWRHNLVESDGWVSRHLGAVRTQRGEDSGPGACQPTGGARVSVSAWHTVGHCASLATHCRLPHRPTSLREQKLKLFHVPVSCALSWACPTSAWHPVDAQQELIKLNPHTVQLPCSRSPQELRQDLPGIFVHARPSRAPGSAHRSDPLPPSQFVASLGQKAVTSSHQKTQTSPAH